MPEGTKTELQAELAVLTLSAPAAPYVRNMEAGDVAPCRICRSMRHTGVYYGAYVCSGCKVFFMRTVAGSTGYVCAADGRCSQPAAVLKCRACRFGKCITIGMRPDNPNRPSTSSPPENGAVVPYFNKSIDIIRPPSGGSPIGLSFLDILRGTPNEPIRLAEKLMALEMYCNQDAGFFFVEENADDYNWQVTLEDAIVDPLIICTRKPAFVKNSRMPCNQDDYIKIFHRSAVYYLDWVTACVEIHSLSKRDQMRLIAPRMSVFHFSMIAYNTYKFSCDNGYLLPNGFCYELDTCWDPYVKNMIRQIANVLMPQMKALKITGQEFCIIKQIIIYSGKLNLSPDGIETVQAARKKYEQLLVYYVEDVYQHLSKKEKTSRIVQLLELKNNLIAAGMVEFEHTRSVLDAAHCPPPCLPYDFHLREF